MPKRSQKLGGFVVAAQPSLVKTPPSGPGWIHEIKHDGYRILAMRRGAEVALWSRAGNDWSDRLKGIREALLALPAEDFVIDGEAVAHAEEGQQDFHGLRSLEGRQGAVYFAFDVLRLAGADLRGEPLLNRKERLQALLRKPLAGLYYVNHLEAEGASVFSHACALGLEGIISKLGTAAYPEGLTTQWLKVKNSGYRRGARGYV